MNESASVDLKNYTSVLVHLIEARWNFLPATRVHKSGEDRSISVVRKINERNQDGEESQNVDDQDQTFEMGQGLATNSVDDHREEYH